MTKDDVVDVMGDDAVVLDTIQGGGEFVESIDDVQVPEQIDPAKKRIQIQLDLNKQTLEMANHVATLIGVDLRSVIDQLLEIYIRDCAPQAKIKAEALAVTFKNIETANKGDK